MQRFIGMLERGEYRQNQYFHQPVELMEVRE
jgi:hypothetical protein